MKKTYEINVQEPYFTYIKDGLKTVEGRLNKGKFLEMNIGDELILNNVIKLEVVNKNVYKTFRDMISSEGMENVIPNAKTLEEAENVYYGFYSKEDENNFGVAAILVKLI